MPDNPIISFRIEGAPIGKQRPRIVKGHAYTPAKTKQWESQIAWAARIAMGANDLLRGNVAVRMCFWRKDKRRVDLDNLCKAALDSINGICVSDDSQVVELCALLIRSASWEGCEIEIKPE